MDSRYMHESNIHPEHADHDSSVDSLMVKEPRDKGNVYAMQYDLNNKYS